MVLFSFCNPSLGPTSTILTWSAAYRLEVLKLRKEVRKDRETVEGSLFMVRIRVNKLVRLEDLFPGESKLLISLESAPYAGLSCVEGQSEGCRWCDFEKCGEPRTGDG